MPLFGKKKSKQKAPMQISGPLDKDGQEIHKGNKNFYGMKQSSNEYIKQFLETGVHSTTDQLTGKDGKKPKAPTIEELKELAKHVPKPGSDKEDWSKVHPELQPDRFDPELKLFNDIEKDRRGIKNPTKKEQEVLDDIDEHTDMLVEHFGLDQKDGLLDKESVDIVAQAVKVGTLDIESVKKGKPDEALQEGKNESNSKTAVTAEKLVGGLAKTAKVGHGLSGLKGSTGLMDGKDGISDMLETDVGLGMTGLTQGLDVVQGLTEVTQKSMQVHRGRKLQKGNQAQKELGDNLVKDGGLDIGKNLMSVGKSGLKATEAVMDVMDKGGGLLGDIAPGFGLVSNGISMGKNISKYKDTKGMQKQTEDVVESMGQDNPMSKLAMNAQKHHSRNKNDALMDAVGDGIGMVGNGLQLAGVQGAGVAGSVVKGGMGAYQTVRDDVRKHGIQKDRKGVMMGDRKAKKRLMENDPRLLAHGMGMMSKLDGQDQESQQRKQGSEDIMKAMNISDEAIEQGSNHDLTELVHNKTETDSKQKMKVQGKLFGKIGVPFAPEYDKTV